MTILGPILCILKLRGTKCGTRDYIAGTTGDHVLRIKTRSQAVARIAVDRTASQHTIGSNNYRLF